MHFICMHVVCRDAMLVYSGSVRPHFGREPMPVRLIFILHPSPALKTGFSWCPDGTSKSSTIGSFYQLVGAGRGGDSLSYVAFLLVFSVSQLVSFLFCGLDFLITFCLLMWFIKKNNVSLNQLGNVFGDSSAWGSCFLFCEQKLWLPLLWSVFQDYFDSEQLWKTEWLQSHWLGLLIVLEGKG